MESLEIRLHLGSQKRDSLREMGGPVRARAEVSENFANPCRFGTESRSGPPEGLSGQTAPQRGTCDTSDGWSRLDRG
jgi:hypothetical protein